MRLNMGLGYFSTKYENSLLSDYSYWNLRGALTRSWLSGQLETTFRSQFQGVNRDPDKYGRLNLGAECGWQFLTNMRASGRLDWQTYTGDRDDSWMQIVVRLTQEF
jgi:hypothetical protein